MLLIFTLFVTKHESHQGAEDPFAVSIVFYLQFLFKLYVSL